MGILRQSSLAARHTITEKGEHVRCVWHPDGARLRRLPDRFGLGLDEMGSWRFREKHSFHIVLNEFHPRNGFSRACRVNCGLRSSPSLSILRSDASANFPLGISNLTRRHPERPRWRVEAKFAPLVRAYLRLGDPRILDTRGSRRVNTDCLQVICGRRF